ncbi:MAG: response regulator transcription factor [Pelosinus sp.]|nr:response regulator transcription factor [Pelosinus sp.]
MQILVAEDESGLRELLRAILTEEKYLVDEAANGEEALFKAEQDIYDLLLVDIMLPGIDGLELVKRLRAKEIFVPVLFLTAKDSIEDRVLGLESGADDYLVKPFAVAELLARIRALLRRRGSFGKEGKPMYGKLTLDPKVKDGYIDGRPLQLTSKEYQLMEFFVLNSEHILTREQIFDRIWGFESEAVMGVVDLYVHYLRKKLAVYQYDWAVQTVRGAGFMLKDKE